MFATSLQVLIDGYKQSLLKNQIQTNLQHPIRCGTNESSPEGPFSQLTKFDSEQPKQY